MFDNELLMELVKMYDEKLKEMMSDADYIKWSTETAKELFKLDIERMEDNDFKDFCKSHFDKITK